MNDIFSGDSIKKVHFMGIRGSGCSAAAAIAKSNGFKVSGCDNSENQEYIKGLENINVQLGHSRDHLEGIDILAISPAILSLDPNNSEVLSAGEKGIKVVTWQAFMGEYLEKGKFVICICGTHGKSTTTAMVALMLEDLGLDPIAELGAVVSKWGSNFRIGKGKYFVSEADEYNGNFLVSYPDISIVTSVEMDHPEYFKSFDEYKKSFVTFLLQTKKLIIANLSDANVAEVVKQVMKASSVSVVDYSKSDFSLKLKVLGDFNILNANAVCSLGLALGLRMDEVRSSLKNYSGLSRRSEYMGIFNSGKVSNVSVYSDYAHHPTEIEVTAKAFRQRFPGDKLMVVFQPHMFTRTKVLFDDFVETLNNLPVDSVLVLDIFASRETDGGEVSSQDIVKAVSSSNVTYATGEDQVSEEIVKHHPDVVVFMGAGSVDKMARELVKK